MHSLDNPKNFETVNLKHRTGVRGDSAAAGFINLALIGSVFQKMSSRLTRLGSHVLPFRCVAGSVAI